MTLRSSFFTKARSSANSFRIVCCMAAFRPGFDEAVAFLAFFFFEGISVTLRWRRAGVQKLSDGCYDLRWRKWLAQ